MSFYRSIITAVAAFGLATTVFAADEATSATTSPTTDTAASAASAAPAMQVADASTTTATPDAATAGEQTKVDVNKATAKELMKVKGLSSAKAKAIVAYRKKHGDFKTLDELKDVKGFKKMNEETMKEIQDQLTM